MGQRGEADGRLAVAPPDAWERLLAITTLLELGLDLDDFLGAEDEPASTAETWGTAHA